MNLKDIKAVVTGGASGLGEAYVRMIVAGGSKAAIFDLKQDLAEKLISELGAHVMLAFLFLQASGASPPAWSDRLD